MNLYYSEDEHAILRKLYSESKRADILAALPGRNWKSVSLQASRLRLTRKRIPVNSWTEQEVAILKECYPSEGSPRVAALTGRSKAAVRAHATLLGLRSEVSLLPGGFRPRANSLDYTIRERNILFSHYPTATRQEIQGLLPSRSWLSIQQLAARLKIRRAVAQTRPSTWTEQELELLRAEFPAQGVSKVARLLNCSNQRVAMCAHSLGLKRLPRVRNPKPMPRQAAKVVKEVKPKAERPTKAELLVLRMPKPVAPAPVKRSPSTPILNVRMEQRLLAEKQREQKPKPYVTADQIRALSAAHPARLAWTRAAYNGPAAATAAFHEAMQAYRQVA